MLTASTFSIPPLPNAIVTSDKENGGDPRVVSFARDFKIKENYAPLSR